MNGYTSHIDTFARERLPPRELWPEFIFELPELRYPDRLNCGVRLLDDAVSESFGARPAIRTETEVITYEQLLEQSNRIANVLVRELGIVPGNRVLLRMPNGPMLIASWLAVMKAGAIAAATMPLLRAGELRAVAERAHIDHALCDARLSNELEQVAAATGLLRSRVLYGNGDLETRMARQVATFANVETASDDVCLLAFTSGTTGVPKATMHFHRDVLAMCSVVAGHLLRTSPDDVYTGSPPIAFTFGLGALLAFPLAFRASVAPVEKPSPQALLEAIERRRATCLFTSPTMYRSILTLAGEYDLGSLRRCVSAGEHLPKATSDAWYAATGLRIVDGIGSTEMIHIFVSASGEAIRPGATGKPLPGYRACLLDDEGRELPPGSSGRLAVKGPTGCRYLNDPRQREYVQNGWNITGDRYRLDADGYFWFEGRLDDMIVSAGYNIAGPEVEGALLAHPAVRECAVIASPDAERGQIVKAFVVLNADFEPGAALIRELQDFVKTAIAPYKYPRAVEFLAELPKTATGKVQRAVLREHELQRHDS